MSQVYTQYILCKYYLYIYFIAGIKKPPEGGSATWQALANLFCRSYCSDSVARLLASNTALAKPRGVALRMFLVFNDFPPNFLC